MIVHGVDTSDHVRPLLLDASGDVLVSAFNLTTTGGKFKLDSSGRLTITGDEPSLLKPTPKNSEFTNLNLPAGASVQTVVTVPNGEVWRMTSFMHRYTGTTAGVNMTSRIVIGGVTMPFLFTNVPTSAFPYVQVLNILLPAAAVISTSINGATLNDDYQGVAFCERVY